MQIWHLTPDAWRDPHRVTPGIPVRLRIGTWPVEPRQQVHVELQVTSWAGMATTDRVPARWVENREQNSYWEAALGPFGDGDRITYRIAGSVGEATVATDEVTFVVGPVISGVRVDLVMPVGVEEGPRPRSGRHGYRVDDPGVLCQPYQAPRGGRRGDGERAVPESPPVRCPRVRIRQAPRITRLPPGTSWPRSRRWGLASRVTGITS